MICLYWGAILDRAATNFVLGYHGCAHSTAEAVLSGVKTLHSSVNAYDWLGSGIYFWEFNAQRAFEFACEARGRLLPAKRRGYRPAVIGAIIDLGLCLNLLDSHGITMVRHAYDELRLNSELLDVPLPKNVGGDDLLLRNLDCAVIRTLHLMREAKNKPAFDSVRAAFIEGERLYENAGFAAKNHIQICVRNPACIQGYFRPLDDDGRLIKF